MKLSQIFEKNADGTDKNSGYIEGLALGHVYGESYDRLLASYTKAPVTLLEIGVDRGGSLHSWTEFFTGTFYGVDIVDKRLPKYVSDRYKFILANIHDPEVLSYFENNNTLFDIIVDDGSHHIYDIVFMVEAFLPRLQKDGIMIIEDIPPADPAGWLKLIKQNLPSNRTAEMIDLTAVNGRNDDRLVVIR